MKVEAILNLDELGMTLTEWKAFAKDQWWAEVVPPPIWSNYIRDMTQGWQRLCTVAEWKTDAAWRNGWTDPGVYALVYDKDNTELHPILSNRTVCFGETTQPLYKRVYTHISALKGNVTNMSEKWSKYDKVVNAKYQCNIREELDKVWVWTRPHNVTDPEWAFSREHSVFMEKQAHAQFAAFWGFTPPANTRDLPSWDLIEKARVSLLETYPGYEKHLQRKTSNLRW